MLVLVVYIGPAQGLDITRELLTLYAGTECQNNQLEFDEQARPYGGVEVLPGSRPEGTFGIWGRSGTIK